MTDVSQQRNTRIGNYSKLSNVGSKHSRDVTSYKITITKNINSKFPSFPVIENRGFVPRKSANLGLALVDLCN